MRLKTGGCEIMQLCQKLIPYFYLLYFVILFAERLQSLVRSFADPAYKVFGAPFDCYVNILSILSLAATVVLLAGFNGSFWASLFGKANADYGILTVTAGVILISGMVHTEYTVAPVQFGAYGMLIVAMVLQTVISSSGSGNAFHLWYSLIYLTVFSMAIPVVYRSEIKKAAVFHIIEAVVSVVLVIAFTYMLYLMFTGSGSNLLLWVPIITAVIGDAVVLAMRWRESVNTFVLIFAVASVILFAVGKILFAVVK